MKVLLLHGPNLNLLGEREPDLYGDMTLEEIDRRIAERAADLGMEVRSHQSNVEGELVTMIQDARGWADAIVLNAGGYTHTSVAIRDAITGVGLPTVGVHLTNPSAREEFRRMDIVGGACVGTVAGFGWGSYILALEALRSYVSPDEALPPGRQRG